VKQRETLPMFIVLYAAAFMSAFNENIINVALVDIMAEFSTTATTAQWLVTGYMAVMAIVVASCAFLLQRFPFRTLFFTAAACFVVGEALCLFAPSFPLLLAARLLQAIGTGIFTPLMMNAVLACAPRERMGTYLAIGSAAITLGPAFAPVLSGLMVTLVGWRSIFLIPLIAVIVITLAGIPFTKNITQLENVRLDLASLALAAIALPLFVFGLGEISPRPAIGAITVAVAAVLLVVFALRQERIENPLLNMRPLLHNALFALAALLVIIGMMTTFSTSVLLPLYFESVFEYTALAAGLLILPAIVINAITAIIAGRTMDRRGPWPLIPLGFACIVVGQFAIALLGESQNVAAVVSASVVVYAGVGLVMSPVQTAGLGILPNREHPDGVSILNTFIMVAASLGPSLFVGIVSKGAESASAYGTSFQAAQAAGFAEAVFVAAAIGLIGFAVSLFFSYRVRTK